MNIAVPCPTITVLPSPTPNKYVVGEFSILLVSLILCQPWSRVFHHPRPFANGCHRVAARRMNRRRANDQSHTQPRYQLPGLFLRIQASKIRANAAALLHRLLHRPAGRCPWPLQQQDSTLRRHSRIRLPRPPHRPTRRKTSRRRAPPSRIPFPEAQSEAAAHQTAEPSAPQPQTAPQSGSPNKPTAAQNPFPEAQSEKAAHQDTSPSTHPNPAGDQNYSSSQRQGPRYAHHHRRAPTGRRFRTALQSEARPQRRPDRRLLPRVRQLAGALTTASSRPIAPIPATPKPSSASPKPRAISVIPTKRSAIIVSISARSPAARTPKKFARP